MVVMPPLAVWAEQLVAWPNWFAHAVGVYALSVTEERSCVERGRLARFPFQRHHPIMASLAQSKGLSDKIPRNDMNLGSPILEKFLTSATTATPGRGSAPPGL